MRSDVARAGRRRAPRLAAALVAALLAGSAAAHATLVFGTVTTDPAPPRAGEPVAIRLELTDPTDTAVEDAVVHVEADPQEEVAASAAAADDAGAGDATMGSTAEPGDDTESDALVVSDRFEEVEPGVYRTEIVLPDDGAWTLTFRDRTFRQEEARASITMDVGADAAAAPLSFIFPPTATGPRSLTTWLVWLIGLPIVAGAVVTVMVLRGPSAADPEDDAEGPDAGDDAPADGRA